MPYTVQTSPSHNIMNGWKKLAAESAYNFTEHTQDIFKLPLLTEVQTGKCYTKCAFPSDQQSSTVALKFSDW